MAAVVLKKRNIRILIITVLLLGLTLTVLKSTTTSITPTSPSATIGSDLTVNKNNDYNNDDARQEDVPMNNDPSTHESSNDNEASLKQHQANQQQQGTDTSAVPDIDIEKEYSDILNFGPIIMFSKTTCPYSRRLKDLLAEHFEFDPMIMAIELDKYPHGRELQEYVGKVTGRRTVPNLMINGKSRGGFDDINELLKSETLYDDLVKWSDNKFTVRKRLTPSSQE